MPGLGQRHGVSACPANVALVNLAEEIARRVRETYSDEALDELYGHVSAPTVTTDTSGFTSLVVPRSQQDEPFRSFHLLDSGAVGDVVVTTFAWGEVDATEMTYVLPLPTSRLDVDTGDDKAMNTLVVRYIEWSLGGPRESWESERATLMGRGMTIVRPWVQDS